MLTSERVTEIRACVRCDVRASVLDDAEIIIDAYEAQRPRPASEVPMRSCRVLILHRYAPTEWESGGYTPDERHRWYTDGVGGALDEDDLIAWLPLPEVPE